MAEIVHRIACKATPAQVFEALSTREGIARWWTRDTTGDGRLGGVLHTRFLDLDGEERGFFKLEVEDSTPAASLRWRVIDGPPEWIDTRIHFDLSTSGDLTVLKFAHRHWREVTDFTGHCSTKWATFLLSLRAYVETGTGQPAPNDLKIDDWN